MAYEVKRLAKEMDVFIEEAERVCEVLQGYTRLSAELVQRVEEGQPLTEVLEQLDGSVRRRELTEAMEDLEVARHRVRLAMFAVGKTQGTNASEVGRKLGISRQLASRLANESEEEFGR